MVHLPGDEDSRVEAIVFDLFHTLVDPQEHSAPGFRRLEAIAGILDLPLPDLTAWWQRRLDELVVSPVSPVEAIVDLARTRRIVLSPTALAEIDRTMGAAQDAALASPLAGAMETLELLGAAGIRLGILSNAHARDVRLLADSPLAAVVHDMCVSCFIGVAKPDPAAYAFALERLDARAECTVFVGDGGGGEFRGARRAGFGSLVAVTGPVRRGGWRSPEEQQQIEGDADVVIEEVANLLGLMFP